MPKHILIAEDEDMLSSMMATVLTKNDIRVSIAANGVEALRIMNAELPDLLLLDLLMPVMDGHNLMKQMKKKKIVCPVIVVTNVNESSLSKDPLVQNYFVKSDMDDDSLWTTIEKVLFPASSQLQ